MELRRAWIALAYGLCIGIAAPVPGQVQTIVPPVVANARPVTVERIRVHGEALEGNLEGESADREVLVVLPPSYAKDSRRRYPVVYALHGYFIGAEQWSREIHVPQTVEGAFAQGAGEMIVVLPDSKTVYLGSFYSSSMTVGDFERFISHDLVAHVDAHYRTLADRRSRGLVGHSMGGYGAARIGMKHPEVFGALYMMSPCCLSTMGGGRPGTPGDPHENAVAAEKRLAAAKTPGELAAASPGFAAAPFATAAAFAPNPKNPPFFFDLPTRDGVPRPEIVAKLDANAPLAFVDQYIGNLRQYRAIAMDVGDQDGLRFDAAELHRVLSSYGLANSFTVYAGTHTSAVADRFQNFVLPFFSQNLCFTTSCR